MLKNSENTAKRILLYAGVVLVILFSFFLFFKYLLGPLLPFLLAFLLALLVLPLSEKLEKKSKITSKIWAVLLLAIFSALLFLFLWLSVGKLFSELYAFVSDEKLLLSNLEELYDRVQIFIQEHFPVLSQKLDGFDVGAHVGELLSRLSMSASVYLAKLAFSLPEAVFFAVVTVLAAYYFSLEGRTILEFFYSFIPASRRAHAIKLLSAFLKGIGGYFKAGGFMMILTFFELLIGFSILGFRYPFLIAIVIAAVDFLPVLGTGTVLVPWSVISFLAGRQGRALGLLALWGVTMLVRQLAEPRIMGKHLGIHPLFSLLASYTGLKLFGIPGMVLLPIGCSVGWGIFKEFQEAERRVEDQEV